MDPTKLGKVLSLAASDNEAEALRAMQTAKRMLARAGLDFVDLANLVTAPEETGDSEAIDELREKLVLLRREIRQLKAENRRLRGGASVPDLKADAAPQLATERAAREQAEADRAQLAAEVRRLKAAAATMEGELRRSEHERFRVAAEARKNALAGIRRPVPRRSFRKSESQYSLF